MKGKGGGKRCWKKGCGGHLLDGGGLEARPMVTGKLTVARAWMWWTVEVNGEEGSGFALLDKSKEMERKSKPTCLSDAMLDPLSAAIHSHDDVRRQRSPQLRYHTSSTTKTSIPVSYKHCRWRIGSHATTEGEQEKKH
ncbi:uncharacterized protein G2W53_033836 [Senna tora]|uniref:Uncharacterized protein n=1 Tax=Senna tora TaxID=362788 RepID=A0A834SZ89_9FABA|nr:uncharacterized protein G2W53_033836 [Senna tora]